MSEMLIKILIVVISGRDGVKGLLSLSIFKAIDIFFFSKTIKCMVYMKLQRDCLKLQSQKLEEPVGR